MNNKGAALIESVLIIPLICFVIILIIQFTILLSDAVKIKLITSNFSTTNQGFIAKKNNIDGSLNNSKKDILTLFENKWNVNKNDIDQLIEKLDKEITDKLILNYDKPEINIKIKKGIFSNSMDIEIEITRDKILFDYLAQFFNLPISNKYRFTCVGSLNDYSESKRNFDFMFSIFEKGIKLLK